VASATKSSAARPSRREVVEGDLVQAAGALLAEGESFTDLSVEQITARAGISRSAFYFYFRDKRELLTRLAAQLGGDFYQLADQWWTGGVPVTREGLKETLTYVLKTYREHAPLMAALIEAGGYDAEIAGFWRGLMERFWDATREHIKLQQKAGKAIELPADATAFALVWMTERVWYQHVTGAISEPIPDEDLVEALTGIIWCAVYGRAWD
jgi:TetR/AcrR family transcriptional regulator, ethionamide resistance regulator